MKKQGSIIVLRYVQLGFFLLTVYPCFRDSSYGLCDVKIRSHVRSKWECLIGCIVYREIHYIYKVRRCHHVVVLLIRQLFTRFHMKLIKASIGNFSYPTLLMYVNGLSYQYRYLKYKSAQINNFKDHSFILIFSRPGLQSI